jgi:hypothetical protein
LFPSIISPKWSFRFKIFNNTFLYVLLSRLYHGATIQSIGPNYSTHLKKKPVPVAARSKAYVCGRWPAETVGSNPAGAWMFFVSVECCQVEISASG